MRHLTTFALALSLLAILVMSCGSGSQASGGVIIEPLPSATPGFTQLGAGPITPLAAADGAAAVPDEPTAPPAEVEATPTSAPAPEPTAVNDSLAPAEGRWIDVDVTNFVVRLMDGTAVMREISPVAVGELVDTGDYASTQTGLFHVYNKAEELVYDAPYRTYISHWVGFDPDKANGFHSFLKDETGKVVDASTGRVSNGCIRTGAEDAIFAFAEVGMPVYVHV
ncbi:MAG: L,D-transpeptidase [Chloroflexi bacterium]|nr:L,D-transpeptidase [Chloroflexota bacterium]